jgi:dinuclear metal center YbgI/SA1388 family protein
MELKALVNYTRQLLEVERYTDYCPNGLQVEGCAEVKKVVSGVTASMALLEAAKDAGADAVLVHHGYFWKGEDASIVGLKRNRIKFLLENNISLLAYHLPLDGHPTLGNNAQLGKLLEINLTGWSGNQNILAQGELAQAQSLQDFTKHLTTKLGRAPLLIGQPDKVLRKIAWCTGGAQGYMQEAIDLGVDAFISGEISEQTVHLARESGVVYIAAGHHATERYGVQALGAHLAEHFGIAHSYIEIDNPV